MRARTYSERMSRRPTPRIDGVRSQRNVISVGQPSGIVSDVIGQIMAWLVVIAILIAFGIAGTSDVESNAAYMRAFAEAHANG